MDPGPDLEAHHHHHTGRRWLDTILAVSAIAISLFSAVMTLQHGRAMEKMVEANTWPYVTIEDASSDLQGHHLYQISVVNNGVGPAKIESMNVSYKGRPASDVIQLARTIAKEAGQPPSRVLESDIAGGVIPARQSMNALTAAAPYSSPEMIEALRQVRSQIDIDICYCSIFDECWTVREQGTIRPKPVKQCPAPR